MINSEQSVLNPWISLIIISVLSFGAALMAPSFLAFLFVSLSDISISEFEQVFFDPFSYPDFKIAIITIQMVSMVLAFIVLPVYFIRRFENGKFDQYLNFDLNLFASISLVLLVISFMGVNSFFIEWNLNFRFPEYIHEAATRWEAQRETLTEFLTIFESDWEFVYAIIAIAVVPAIGEELLFRGIIQKQLLLITKNQHLAIWLAAIIFSAFHFQFFGFVPRMLLGALFGYLFIFSGNLLYPMMAHFVNNAFTLLMIYLYQNELVSYDIENTESVPLETVGIFAIIGALLLYFFYKQLNPQPASINE